MYQWTLALYLISLQQQVIWAESPSFTVMLDGLWITENSSSSYESVNEKQQHKETHKCVGLLRLIYYSL